MEIGIYTIFLVTTVLLILVPGPAAITIAGQGASQGNRMAFLGVLGVASADAIFFALSATGIASLIVASSLAFSIVKWLGVAYLFYLGISSLVNRTGLIAPQTKQKRVGRQTLFLQGLVVQLANPKALIYFTALLPQFIDPAEPVLIQFLLMGATCVVADMIVYSLFSRLGDQLARLSVHSWVATAINRLAGITLIALGVRMARVEYGQ